MSRHRVTDDHIIPLRQNCYKMTIHFVNCKVDTTYTVMLQELNKVDLNPLLLMPAVIEKHRTHFCVELIAPPDTCNYELRYVVIGEDSHPNTIENILDMPSKKTCDHKWAKYDGFTDKYEFCEHCDTKR